MTPLLDFSEAVRIAQAANRPLVALESTIIAHGMPYPANLETARTLEDLIRAEGAEPATIAVLDGRIKVGLTATELERLARGGAQIMKASVRDIPFAMAQGLDAATTVASTMRIASLGGIRVFATGGIGGVHRGAQDTFDISADLTELARSPVAVVTAGAKAILDLALTLETLETLSVPVIGFATDTFPAFYSRSSGLALPVRLDTPQAVARFLQAKWTLADEGGVVVAAPIPVEFEILAQEIEPVIVAALAEAARSGIEGKKMTPFLLARLAELTQGRSLAANIALARNNATIGARIAVALQQANPVQRKS